jgi:hypothetical protein
MKEQMYFSKSKMRAAITLKIVSSDGAVVLSVLNLSSRQIALRSPAYQT